MSRKPARAKSANKKAVGKSGKRATAKGAKAKKATVKVRGYSKDGLAYAKGLRD